MRWALDSWAVLCWLEDEEPGASIIEQRMEDQPLMSWINLGEVFYILIRRVGELQARRLVRNIRNRVITDDVTPARVMTAARIKAHHAMALADAFAVATAHAHDAVLLTGDPEILSAAGPWKVKDLREPSALT